MTGLQVPIPWLSCLTFFGYEVVNRMQNTPAHIYPRVSFGRYSHWTWRCRVAGLCAVWACTVGSGVQAAGSHAPVQPRAQGGVAQSTPVTPVTLTQEMGARLAAPECQSLRLDTTSLLALQQLLQPLGLGIRVLGCPMAPPPLPQRVLAVTAVVLDGAKAVDTVRGALGDGEPVDMGSEYRPTPWPVQGNAAQAQAQDDAEVSPDVLFNRRWLRSVMASQGYASVTGPWWAFVRSPHKGK